MARGLVSLVSPRLRFARVRASRVTVLGTSCSLRAIRSKALTRSILVGGSRSGSMSWGCERSLLIRRVRVRDEIFAVIDQQR